MMYHNIAGYLFSPLGDLSSLQNNFKTLGNNLSLKGTILLGAEGINLFVCGTHESIDSFKTAIALILPSFNFKVSLSDFIPFKRFIVKIKKEIITMGVDEINPICDTAPRISPSLLKQWLDDKKPIIILDTRNDYEINIGKFKDAIHLDIKQFTEFPNRLDALKPFQDLPVITYCTGGIRCEKAAPLLMKAGFKEVYQLDGGILNYFEQCSHAHFEGECFVFDERIAVNERLMPTTQSYPDKLIEH